MDSPERLHGEGVKDSFSFVFCVLCVILKKVLNWSNEPPRKCSRPCLHCATNSLAAPLAYQMGTVQALRPSQGKGVERMPRLALVYLGLFDPCEGLRGLSFCSIGAGRYRPRYKGKQ